MTGLGFRLEYSDEPPTVCRWSAAARSLPSAASLAVLCSQSASGLTSTSGAVRPRGAAAAAQRHIARASTCRRGVSEARFPGAGKSRRGAIPISSPAEPGIDQDQALIGALETGKLAESGAGGPAPLNPDHNRDTRPDYRKRERPLSGRARNPRSPSPICRGSGIIPIPRRVPSGADPEIPNSRSPDSRFGRETGREFPIPDRPGNRESGNGPFPDSAGKRESGSESRLAANREIGGTLPVRCEYSWAQWMLSFTTDSFGVRTCPCCLARARSV